MAKSSTRHTIEHLDVEAGTMTLALDPGLYPIDVIYGASYVLIDRCYVLLDRAQGEKGKGGRYLVHLRGKQTLDKAGLEAISGEFGNELLSQALRRKINRANAKVIEEIVTQAIAGAAGAGLPQDFVDDEDDMDFLDDPLGIAVPWEEKFSKKKKDDSANAG